MTDRQTNIQTSGNDNKAHSLRDVTQQTVSLLSVYKLQSITGASSVISGMQCKPSASLILETSHIARCVMTQKIAVDGGSRANRPLALYCQSAVFPQLITRVPNSQIYRRHLQQSVLDSKKIAGVEARGLGRNSEMREWGPGQSLIRGAGTFVPQKMKHFHICETLFCP